MNWGRRTVILFLLALVPAFYSPAQTNNAADSKIFDTTNFPQWAKDLRRWEIVAFGSIPFAMFTATFAMDMYRWNDANGLDFSEEGRRYAPWPLKSAGAELMDRAEQERVFMIAGSLAIAVAMADLVVVQIKRYQAKKRADALPVGTTIITRQPWGEPDEAVIDEVVPEDSVPELP